MMDNTAPNTVMVFPKTVLPGGKLTVTVDGTDCREADRAAMDASVESAAFTRTKLMPLRNEGSSFATPMITDTSKPGRYTVTATCKGKSVTAGEFTVLPVAGSRTGEGGSIAQVSTTEAVVGGGLVAAAIGGGVLMLRRRQSGGDT
ncbi:hypothetical protein [Wenjunlia tyrosinilytica]|uniref:Uncharacterized protein n=1 Tax=Wenjunlia tyrosinilytica TaxID=1544741 RepID=A0A917ZQP6_9ACTN|nr:hypothetical protein [Wenjunlia tyrosinilytica]GGO88561.1 hypothetical protein GCM10012280_29680 [Wenjunlia tyrosinilytica]